MAHFSTEPRGPFLLAQANSYFGGWPALASDPGAIAMAFPVEGWRTSAAVVVRQDSAGVVNGEVFGADAHDAELAWSTALAAVSLDVGAFIAQGILIRGAGLADEISDDEVTSQAVQYAYGLASAPDRATIVKLAEPWRPYRAWAMVLLHMWLRREDGPGFQRPGRQSRVRSRS